MNLKRILDPTLKCSIYSHCSKKLEEVEKEYSVWWDSITPAPTVKHPSICPGPPGLGQKRFLVGDRQKPAPYQGAWRIIAKIKTQRIPQKGMLEPVGSPAVLSI